jgi:Na+/melibiose symporter-like transporter
MKKAFGLIELLIVLIIFISLYFACFKTHKRINPFDDGSTQEKVQQIDKKINEIEQTKLMKQKIEQNLNKEF